MVTRTVVLFVAATFVLSAAGPVAQMKPAAWADEFAATVGVNIHLHHTDTSYGDFEMVRARLAELGARHVRDGLVPTTWAPYYARHNALGDLGIKGTFIAAPDASLEELRTFPSKVSRSFEAYEAPNELDLSGDAAWTATLRRTLTSLRQLQNIPEVRGYPVIGPSLTSESAFGALGDVSTFYDRSNLHNYFSGRHPGTDGWGSNGYGSIRWNIDLLRRYAPSRPVITTETGYWDDRAVRDSLPQDVVARYMPRLLLEQFRHGITRTFIYELLDDPTSGVAGRSGYGLVRADGSRKPAFSAVANLLRIMTDRGPRPEPQVFAYTLAGRRADLREMTFQKSDGSFLLALWLETPSYDLERRRAITVTPVPVTISDAGAQRLLRTYRWRPDGSVDDIDGDRAVAPLTVSVGDTLTLLHFGVDGERTLAAPRNLRIISPTR